MSQKSVSGTDTVVFFGNNNTTGNESVYSPIDDLSNKKYCQLRCYLHMLPKPLLERVSIKNRITSLNTIPNIIKTGT